MSISSRGRSGLQKLTRLLPTTWHRTAPCLLHPTTSTPHPLPAPQLCHTHPFLLVITELCAGGDLQSLLHLPEVGLDMRSIASNLPSTSLGRPL